MDRKRSLNPEDTLYNCLSQFMSANASFPPLNDSDIDIFDIVNNRATGPPGNILESTDVFLCDVLSPGERNDLQARIENGELSQMRNVCLPYPTGRWMQGSQ
ncbi:hypothetical protein BWQ96_04686 [Gracilariopsis chorda]|uniref:Uncharacterized protein n=1 Tax=Gracilariopsis chorda TaxID=448386 RepID=A0A2V3ITT8_9FLOR|nr:hypothetical protein BWQ96_04686 [Gracilariopsis chorda]|eukprot:PXF45548.1 hypothetical protein BWQ96_04686 [Gracilariopsis chorda]